MIKVKPGVKFHHVSFIQPEVLRIIWIAQLTAPPEYEITITSGCDGKHVVNSSHYKGKAFDFRIRDFPEKYSVQTWVDMMQRKLGDCYFVLRESNHIHVQYNG